MAPKQTSAPVDSSSDPLVILFKSIGLTQPKAVEANKNPKSAALLKDLIEKHDLAAVGLDEKQAVLVTAFAGNLSKSSAVGDAEKSFVISKILECKLKSVDQVSGKFWILCGMIKHNIPSSTAATKYVEARKVPINIADFDKQCGVGMSSAALKHVPSHKFIPQQASVSRQKSCTRRLRTMSPPML